MVSDYQQTHQQVANGCHITSGASATGRTAQTSGGRVDMRTSEKEKQYMHNAIDIELAVLYGLEQTLADKVDPSPLEVEYFQKCISDQHRRITRIKKRGF